MTNDRWYKRLGWFLFFSAITLLIFFIIDLISQKIVSNYESKEVVAYFVDSEGNKMTGPIIIEKSPIGNSDVEPVKLKIYGNVNRYKITVAISGEPLAKEFENTSDIEFNIPSIPGEYIVTCNYHAYPMFGMEQDILLTIKVIVVESEEALQ